ncbi:sensor histidine kinase [Acidimicrobiia bacterium EGI L10123]|uniref:sensor histidine kinase n=1 Tax=Salinilacustrithrix flava TaxID=2957203 RepID=UPI003D7C3499|nr:sensor histidine kinase [Acidimicrobiia bacterium EGI L10123]
MKFRIRSKLAAALAVPLVALVVMSGLQAVQAQEESDRIEAEADRAFVALGPGSVTTALQNERNYLSLDLIGLAGATTLDVSSAEQAIEETDTALSQLERAVTGMEPEVQAAYAPAFEVLDDLPAVRRAFDGFDGDKGLDNQELADEVFSAYTEMVAAFFDATSVIATQVDEAALRNGVELVDAASRRSETIAAATRNVVLDTLTGSTSIELRVASIGLVDRLESLDARIQQLSVGSYADVATETFARPETERYMEIFQGYVTGEEVDITELLANVGTQDGVASIAELTTDALAGEASTLSADAYDEFRFFVLVAAGVIALAIIVTYVATTSITRPLRKLRDEADAMAGRRLPEAVRSILDTPFGDDVEIPELAPIQVKTRDEVGEVVEALNKVQDRTLALAADQAVLRRNIADSFVNLGRRNQNLLDRQLEFITELEQLETEPDQLEALFRLDHLATRMRRNAESLLVLAGTESPRQWGLPVDLDAVIRAGLGEVEDYRRVSVRNLEDAAIAGGAAAGVSHVVAELTENALQFSPPDEDVEIKGRRSHDGYVIAIADNGIGMSAEDLERANRRLSGEESYTVAPSKYLGHYVAGQLAARLGVTVRLQDNPAGGLIATLVVPPSLLEEPVVDGAPVPTPAADAAPEQPAPEAPAPEPVEEPQVDQPDVEVRAEVPADHHDAPTPAGAPASLSEALGGGRLDAVETVADLERAFDGPAEPPAPSSNGLPRRIPGAQRPDAAPLAAHRRAAEEEATAQPTPPPAPEVEAETSAADAPSAGLFGFLAAFEDGAARATQPGETETHTTEATTEPVPGHSEEEQR